MFKVITILLNILIIIFSIYTIIIGKVISISQPIDALVFLSFYILPSLNLLMFLKSADKSHWIYLFLKTKALKEKRRILEMKKEKRVEENDFDSFY